MKISIRNTVISSVLLALGSVSAFADSSAAMKEKMIRDLDFIEQVFATGYAPAIWKNQTFGWSLGNEIGKAKFSVIAQKEPSVAKFQNILRGFFNSTKDYHVGIQFLSTEKASLPFTVRGAEGRYFIRHIDREKLSEAAFPFEIGDELISFDGLLVKDAVEKIRVEVGENNTPSTDLAYAELLLTRRRQGVFSQVPQGPVSIEVKSQKTEKTSKLQLIWEYVAEQVPSLFHKTANSGSKFSFMDRRMVSPSILDFMHSFAASEDLNLLGKKKSFLPKLGVPIWETAETDAFHAYVYKAENGKLIGYVRIPAYSGESEDDNEELVKNSAEFSKIVKHLQKISDALVIDQVNNPGGSVFYLYGLAGMLTDQALTTPRHRMTLTQADVLESVNTLKTLVSVKNDEDAKKVLGETLHGFPVTYQTAKFVMGFSQFNIDQWKAGKQLTDPYYIMGADQINPNPEANYTKPILVLVNSLDFSGGDFFPAIMQDNKRVTVMGVRTAGAGGYINSVKFPNLFGIGSFSYTGSIAERADRNPIENLGVTPDVNYSVSVKDLQGNYEEYVKAINSQISTMAK